MSFIQPVIRRTYDGLADTSLKEVFVVGIIFVVAFIAGTQLGTVKNGPAEEATFRCYNSTSLQADDCKGTRQKHGWPFVETIDYTEVSYANGQSYDRAEVTDYKRRSHSRRSNIGYNTLLAVAVPIVFYVALRLWTRHEISRVLADQEARLNRKR